MSKFDLMRFKGGGVWSAGIELDALRANIASGRRPLYPGSNEFGHCLQDVYAHLRYDNFDGFARYDISVYVEDHWAWAGPFSAHEMAGIQGKAIRWMERQNNLQHEAWSRSGGSAEMPHQPMSKLFAIRDTERQRPRACAVWMNESTQYTRGVFSLLAPDGMRPGDMVPQRYGSYVAYRPHDDPANSVDWSRSHDAGSRQAAQPAIEPTRVRWWKSFAQWISLADKPAELHGVAMDGVWGNAQSWTEQPGDMAREHHDGEAGAVGPA